MEKHWGQILMKSLIELKDNLIVVSQFLIDDVLADKGRRLGVLNKSFFGLFAAF